MSRTVPLLWSVLLTENPSFEVISPLLSRTRVLVLNPLSDNHVREIVKRAVNDSEKGVGAIISGIENDALDALVSLSNGDARKALNTLEIAGHADWEKRWG